MFSNVLLYFVYEFIININIVCTSPCPKYCGFWWSLAVLHGVASGGHRGMSPLRSHRKNFSYSCFNCFDFRIGMFRIFYCVFVKSTSMSQASPTDLYQSFSFPRSPFVLT